MGLRSRFSHDYCVSSRLPVHVRLQKAPVCQIASAFVRGNESGISIFCTLVLPLCIETFGKQVAHQMRLRGFITIPQVYGTHDGRTSHHSTPVGCKIRPDFRENEEVICSPHYVSRQQPSTALPTWPARFSDVALEFPWGSATRYTPRSTRVGSVSTAFKQWPEDQKVPIQLNNATCQCCSNCRPPHLPHTR
jgi:hypothetical protein